MNTAEELADVPRRRVRRLHRGVMRAGRRTRSAAHSHHTLWKYPPSSTRTSLNSAEPRGSCSRSSCSSPSSTFRAAVAGGRRAPGASPIPRVSQRSPSGAVAPVGSPCRLAQPSVAPCAMELTEPSRAWSTTSHPGDPHGAAARIDDVPGAPRDAGGVASGVRSPPRRSVGGVGRRRRAEHGGGAWLPLRSRVRRRLRAIDRGRDGMCRISRCAMLIARLGRGSARRGFVHGVLCVVVDRARGSGCLACMARDGVADVRVSARPRSRARVRLAPSGSAAPGRPCGFNATLM